MTAQIPYLISKVGDPIFAIFIGTSAAFLRIRREEKERGTPQDQLWETFKRRASLVGK